MAAKTAKPAAKPAAKPTSKPAEKPVSKPTAATRAAATPATKPAVEAAEKPAQKAAAKPAQKAAAKPEAHATAKPTAKPEKGAKPAKGGSEKGKSTGFGHGKATGSGDTNLDLNVGDSQQQEIDILRSQVSELTLAGVWTDVNPPKFTGVYGKMLQGLDAGVSLRDAFGRLYQAALSVRDNSAAVLKLVQDHKTPSFKPAKGK